MNEPQNMTRTERSQIQKTTELQKSIYMKCPKKLIYKDRK